MNLLFYSTRILAPSRFYPPFPYATEEGVIEDFRAFMPYAYASICNSSWTEQKFPRGNSFEREHPSTLVSGMSTGKGSVNLLYNDYLKSIVISFKPTLTTEQLVQDMRVRKSSPFSLSSNTIVEYFTKETRMETENGALLKKPFDPQFFTPKRAFLHYGFQNVYNAFRNETLIVTAMLARRFPDYRIVFTGHSLGAAVAQIASVDFSIQESMQSSRIWLFAFASPRVGNKVWVDFVNQQEFAKLGHIQRLTRLGDPVSNLPPRILGYKHTFLEHIIWDNLTITACPRRNKVFRLPWIIPREEIPDSECFSADPSLSQVKLNFHPPRMYMSYLGLQFNCTAKGW